MRTELTLLEKIDLYASGKLTGAELIDFEQALASDETLRSQVEMHEDMSRAVRRKALRSQIATVAAAGGSGGGLSNVAIGIGAVVAVGVLVMATLFVNGTFDDDSKTDLATNLIGDHQIAIHPIKSGGALPQVENYKEYAEEAETIFSSHQHYADNTPHNDDMNVTVRFRSRGEGVKVELPNISMVDNDINDKQPDREIATLEPEDFKAKNFGRKAAYPGGNGAMKKFIDKNLYYPQSAIEKSIECVVRCEFHVTEDGLISEINAECIKMAEKDGVAYNDVKLLMNRRIMNAFIGNATHILRTMPTWEPAKNAQGNPILSVQRMYFNYDLERGCLVYQLEED